MDQFQSIDIFEKLVQLREDTALSPHTVLYNPGIKVCTAGHVKSSDSGVVAKGNISCTVLGLVATRSWRAQISCNMAPFINNTPKLRIVILHYRYQHSYSMRKISSLLNISKSTVYDVVKRSQKKFELGLADLVSNSTGCGRPKKLSTEMTNSLLQVACNSPFSTIDELQQGLKTTYPDGPHLSHLTIAQILNEDGELFSRVARKKPFLKENHEAAQLQWCLKRQHWTAEEWGRVILSDESPVEIGPTIVPSTSSHRLQWSPVAASGSSNTLRMDQGVDADWIRKWI